MQKYGVYIGDFAGGLPALYADKNTVTEVQMEPLYYFWQYCKAGQTGDQCQADMEKIAVLLRIADYQP